MELGYLPSRAPERALKTPPSPLSNLLRILLVNPRGEIKPPHPQDSPGLYFECLPFHRSPPFRASCDSWSPKMVSTFLSTPPTFLAFKEDRLCETQFLKPTPLNRCLLHWLPKNSCHLYCSTLMPFHLSCEGTVPCLPPRGQRRQKVGRQNDGNGRKKEEMNETKV